MDQEGTGQRGVDTSASGRSTDRQLEPARIGRLAAAGLTRGLLELVLPGQCVVCGDLLGGPTAVWICRACRQGLSGPGGAPCPRCAAIRANSAAACVECGQRRFRFQGASSLGPYHDLLREVVLRMKRASQQVTAYHVGRLLAVRHARRAGWRELDLVVPIPKHWLQRILGGTNSAEWIARGIASATGLRVAMGLLVKARTTSKQSLLAKSQRRSNIRGAFAVRRKAQLQGKRVLLVDDLMTTGATADEAARTLLAAGASCVRIAVAARAQSLWPSWVVGSTEDDSPAADTANDAPISADRP